MEQFWRKKSFKVLHQTWNRRLQEAGFTDCEVDLKGDRALKQRATNCYRQASELEREARLDYYSYLGHLAHNTTFPNELEKIVMTKYSEGSTIKEILTELNKKGISRHRNSIKWIVRRWETKWGVRSWSLQQRNLKK